MSIQRFITVLILLFTLQLAFAQKEKAENEKIGDRFFMPSIQMGYIHHLPDELSGGLLVQTSLEYKTRRGFFFRLNYDDFDSNFELRNPQSALGVIQGNVSFTEFLGGIGYRASLKKHHFLIVLQTGRRLYSSPILTEQGNDLILELESSGINVNRYTFGYEYEIEPRVFLVLEGFASHARQAKDFWEERRGALGFTLGITATIF
ncbi:MAG: hypothetical protein AAFY71_02980 [Bacteroidota bacterium]